MKHPLPRAALVAGLVLAAIAPVSAQTTLGFRAGANLSTLGGEDVDEAESRTGLNIGGYLTLGLAPNVGLQIGGSYSQKGATQTIDEGGTPVDVTFGLDYFEVPILLRLGVPAAGSLSPHFFAGPAVAFEASCEAQGTVGEISATVDCGDLIETKSVDFGAVGGAGVSIATPGMLTITLDVLYNLGLTSVVDDVEEVDVKNRAWSFLAGAAFPIG